MDEDANDPRIPRPLGVWSVKEHVYPKFARIVRHFQEKGELAELPVDSIIRLTITSLAGFLAARFLLLPDHNWDDEAEMERTIHVLMNGLRR
ncbi:hypothetical protein BJQ97_02549 [Geobacillus sp. TFV-3]|nr:hypothetical protein BJQ97_02549 [Geobacillus sp. TFV-3]